MTKLEALTDLAAKVESGEYNGAPFTWHLNKRVSHAYHGSLDAAKALHEALLPGWDIQITTYEDDSFEASVARPMEVRTYDGVSMYMARAWLLAIIRALIAEERAQALQDLADADRDLL